MSNGRHADSSQGPADVSGGASHFLGFGSSFQPCFRPVGSACTSEAGLKQHNDQQSGEHDLEGGERQRHQQNIDNHVVFPPLACISRTALYRPLDTGAVSPFTREP